MIVSLVKLGYKYIFLQSSLFYLIWDFLFFSFLGFYLQFKPEEITAIMKDFDEPGSLAPTGLHLGGAKYMVIQGEPGAVVRGKKVNYHSFS